jgi:hypothetical protein
MYTVIRHYTVTSGSVDDALKQVEAGFVPTSGVHDKCAADHRP